ncbi:MAG: hypothetical protein A3F67_08615 [Verrucomicrobia bacterium RIFCSPHIGHO2_12_FULL_41_10]|nr:MAG: hypothetical protein A3F67_08615 [Verrucomicrobia bacterium RIFCSPHIGHO2_12_FULL_41_10]HLB33585.1 hypothetical protein [Chthoniobacterales bacterium]
MFNLNLTPAHLHLALNHIPIIGLAFASFPIVIGILARCRTTIATGLLATLLCASVMPTIMQTGHDASQNFKSGINQPPLDEAGKIALHLHANRARKTTPVVYSSALLAILALLALIKFSHPSFANAATWLSAAVLLGNTIAILLAIWTADAGGHIRHLELRSLTLCDQTATNSPTSVLAQIPTPSPAPTITPVVSTVPAPSTIELPINPGTK